MAHRGSGDLRSDRSGWCDSPVTVPRSSGDGGSRLSPFAPSGGGGSGTGTPPLGLRRAPGYASAGSLAATAGSPADGAAQPPYVSSPAMGSGAPRLQPPAVCVQVIACH
jgi:hypothetical protein